MRLLLACAIAVALLLPASAEAGPLRNGLRKAGAGAVKVLKRVRRPFRGC